MTELPEACSHLVDQPYIGRLGPYLQHWFALKGQDLVFLAALIGMICLHPLLQTRAQCPSYVIVTALKSRSDQTCTELDVSKQFATCLC